MIILETKMLESWCNSLPGKQIYEYLGQQAAAERWSIWQAAKYALLQLPNKLRISFPNLEYSFLIKKIPLTCFFVYEEVDRLSMVEKLSIKWYFHSGSLYIQQTNFCPDVQQKRLISTIYNIYIDIQPILGKMLN